MDSPSASSSTNPSLVFTCSQIPNLPDCPYTLNDFQRFRREQKLIDIQLKIGQTRLQAHRIVLANSSPVLGAMLSPNWDPEKKDVCELGEDVVHQNIAGDLLDFFYLREVTITIANAKQLWIAANYLDLSTLKAGIEQFFSKHLQFSSDDIVDWLHFITMYQIESFLYSCMTFVFENYTNVLKSEKLLEFSEDYLLQLLKDLKVFGSSIVNRALFELLIKWIKFDITTRADSLLNFLKMFPFLDVSESFITNTVLQEELIINSQDCFELVNNSLNELSSLLKEKHLYFVGQLVFHLDASAGKWTKKSPMIHSRKSNFCSAASGDKIYIFGGFWIYTDSKTVEVFDIKNDDWTELSPMPVRRRNAAAVALNGYIYVSGGYKNSSYNELGSLDRYCVGTNEWTSMAPMLKTRVDHKMVTFNDFIFAICGDRDGTKPTVEKYSPGANQWEMVPAFELRNEDFTVLHQGKFYAFNVYPEHLIDKIDTVNVYDPLTDSTETFQDSGAVQIFNKYVYPTCVSVGDKIWALDCRRSIFGEFDPVTRKWKKIHIDMSILDDEYYNVVVPQR